jgi:hypothetical protein
LSDAGLIGEERLPPHVERGNELWLKLFSRTSVIQTAPGLRRTRS